jgi:uncharacterized protein (DUF924 family)
VPSDVESAEEVLDFWFGREGEPGYGEFREAWFKKDPDFDRQIRDRFETLYEEARSCLALVILLDQFRRNMFRGDPRSYATDRKAQETAEYVVERILDRELPPFQRAFLYMPFMYSDNLEHQRRSRRRQCNSVSGRHSGLASGVNNAVSRTACLLAIPLLGSSSSSPVSAQPCSSQRGSRSPARWRRGSWSRVREKR